MRTTTSRPDPLAWTVFRGTQAINDGLITAKALRSQAWVRLRYDVYADARLEQDHRLVCQAAALSLPADAVMAGRSAALLHGVDHAATFHDPVHVIVPPDSTFFGRAGLVVHRVVVDAGHLDPVSVPPRTTALRTAWDVAIWHDLPAAVSIVDVLLRLGVVDGRDLAALAAAAPSPRGARRAAQVFGLADGRAQSPPESQLRVRLILAGLPTPVPQCPVTVAAGLVVHVDLGWEEYRVAIEYDGQWHAEPDQLHLDRRRLNRLQAAGWIVLHATSVRMGRAFPGLTAEVRDALRSRGWSG
jgi:hypothetical protein